MAQEIGYHDDGVVFTEGPFVICNPLNNGWRIEAELRGAVCPVAGEARLWTAPRRPSCATGSTQR